MKRCFIRFGIGLAVILGIATTHTGRSGAQDVQIRRGLGQNAAVVASALLNCTSPAANATRTMVAGQLGVEITRLSSYGTATCNRYIADINVPSTWTPPPGHRRGTRRTPSG